MIKIDKHVFVEQKIHFGMENQAFSAIYRNILI